MVGIVGLSGCRAEEWWMEDGGWRMKDDGSVDSGWWVVVCTGMWVVPNDQLNLLVFARGPTDDRATAEAAQLRLMPLPIPIPAADAVANVEREAPCLIMQTVGVPIKRTVSGLGHSGWRVVISNQDFETFGENSHPVLNYVYSKEKT